jgi:5-methylcytosine-specific restriction endonuclease McrA
MVRCKSKTEYPDNWREIATARKRAFNYRCERCNEPHNAAGGYCLTVHHLDGDKSNNEHWNLAVLCQKCHLYMQGTVIMSQLLFDFVEVSDWFKPHLDGYKNSLKESK